MNARNLLGSVALCIAFLAGSPAAHAAKGCLMFACWIDVSVVDDGAGGKKLVLEEDGNVQLNRWTRFVSVTWTLKTPGYEFRDRSIAPKNTSAGAWNRQIVTINLPAANSIWLTDRNTEKVNLDYTITVYPAAGTPGRPIVVDPAIMNDP